MIIDTTIKTLKFGYGTAYYQMDTDGQLLISYINVTRAYRKQGHAKALLVRLCRLADEISITCKLAVSPLNSKTSTLGLIRLYQRFDFELTGEYTNILGDPWMKRLPQIID